jgi:NitT/TauT family transport system ATP-binding protein
MRPELDASDGIVPDEADVTQKTETTLSPMINLSDVTFGYEGRPRIIEKLSLQVGRGEIVALIGPSGCGKSTVLNLIAGLLTPTSGTVETDGGEVRGLNPRVAYMTQRDTLLPWRTCLDNAALPLEIRGVPKKERYARARVELERVGVAAYENARPHELSGGMRSRLSLARSLLSDTDIFLMDEPVAAIDALLRVRLQQQLLDIWDATRKTMVYVTHDLDEAIVLGHRVIVLGRDGGRICMEKMIPMEHPRDIAQIKASEQARALSAELWDALEAQVP